MRREILQSRVVCLKNGYLLIYKTVKPEDLMENMVVEASKKSSNYANDSNRNEIYNVIPHRNITYIKHDQTSFSKKSTVSRFAVFYEGSEYHHHDCSAEKSSP